MLPAVPGASETASSYEALQSSLTQAINSLHSEWCNTVDANLPLMLKATLLAQVRRPAIARHDGVVDKTSRGISGTGTGPSYDDWLPNFRIVDVTTIGKKKSNLIRAFFLPVFGRVMEIFHFDTV